MVSNQKEFNKEYSKEIKEIEIDYEDFEEKHLVVEDYPNLEKIYLQNVESIEKIILKNLTQLQEFTIWDCGMKELVIENCPQIKKLNVENNSLGNLEFLKDLGNLEELKINGNTELTKFLEPYYNKSGLDWKTYQKNLQGSSENIQKLLEIIRDLKEKIKQLEENQPITIDNPINFEKKYQKLKKKLNFLLKEEELKTEEISSLKTDDLTEGLEKQKNELSNLQKSNKELKKQLSSFEQLYFAKKQELEQKEKELEGLKNTLLEKYGNYSKEILQKKLTKLLKFQIDITTLNAPSAIEEKEEIKEELIEETSITDKELDDLCQKQEQIANLKLEIQKSFNQVHVNIEKIDRSIIHFESKFVDNSSAGTINAQIEVPPKGQN